MISFLKCSISDLLYNKYWQINLTWHILTHIIVIIFILNHNTRENGEKVLTRQWHLLLCVKFKWSWTVTRPSFLVLPPSKLFVELMSLWPSCIRGVVKVVHHSCPFVDIGGIGACVCLPKKNCLQNLDQKARHQSR